MHGFIESMDVSLSKLWEMWKDREAWHAVVHGVAKNKIQLRTEQQQQRPVDDGPRTRRQRKLLRQAQECTTSRAGSK